jgi:hypothetical protein
MPDLVEPGPRNSGPEQLMPLRSEQYPVWALKRASYAASAPGRPNQSVRAAAVPHSALADPVLLLPAAVG